MSRHGQGGGPPEGPGTPEPTFAEQARTLVHLGRAGTLGTLSRRHPGHPFVSIMPYAPDERGRPLLLISTLAMHTQNLAADPRASLLVAQPGDDPLALARLTLMGHAGRLESGERPAAREAYLARHPNAIHWVDFDDFAFWRLDVADVYFVGGFGAMDWLTVPGYEAARPDPLADAAPGIIEHTRSSCMRACWASSRRKRPRWSRSIVSASSCGFAPPTACTGAGSAFRGRSPAPSSAARS